MNINYLLLVYEKIRNNYPNYLVDIGQMVGVDVNIDQLEERKTSKIITDEFSLEFKKCLQKRSKRDYT